MSRLEEYIASICLKTGKSEEEVRQLAITKEFEKYIAEESKDIRIEVSEMQKEIRCD